MLLDRWRARRAIATRTSPSIVDDIPDPRLTAAVEALKPLIGAEHSLGDPSWHHRWEGALQLVGLDARTRSVTDVRQRLLRLIHETDLQHLPRSARRALAVVLCEPEGGEGLAGWHTRLQHDQDEVGVADWRAARGRIAVLLLDGSDGHELFGGDAAVRGAVEKWERGAAAS